MSLAGLSLDTATNRTTRVGGGGWDDGEDEDEDEDEDANTAEIRCLTDWRFVRRTAVRAGSGLIISVSLESVVLLVSVLFRLVILSRWTIKQKLLGRLQVVLCL